MLLFIILLGENTVFHVVFIIYIFPKYRTYPVQPFLALSFYLSFGASYMPLALCPVALKEG
jgi:hypothetical protein